MARFEQVDPRTATGRARELLEEVTARLGSISNMAKTMAVSPATLEGWVAHTDTKIIASTLVVRGVVLGVTQSVPGRRAGGHGGDKQGGDS